MTPEEVLQVAGWMVQAFLASFGGVVLARFIARSFGGRRR